MIVKVDTFKDLEEQLDRYCLIIGTMICDELKVGTVHLAVRPMGRFALTALLVINQ
jgi:hypothetical protein